MGDATPSAGSGGLGFPLARRLKRKRFIEPLFDRNNPDRQSIRAGCVRIVFRFVPEGSFDAPFQVGVAVGKSRGHAPRRNRIKRVIRETLRHGQDSLERCVAEAGQPLTAMVLFQGSDEPAATIRRDVEEALRRLIRRSPDRAR
ncbi:MAG: ribonuclease P protein component [Bacteroidetes bacterium]|nr:ribonuclease P protein component [Bacteroidota bacterium]MDA0874023.1 ribonuclease P protein component [Bacteroidota bacterium]